MLFFGLISQKSHRMNAIILLLLSQDRLLSLLKQDYYAQKKRLKIQSLAIKTFAVRRGLDRRAKRR